MNVIVPQLVFLPPEVVCEVFQARLQELKNNCHLDTKDRLIQTVGTHPHNGDDVDELFVGIKVDTDVIRAAIVLEKALKAQRRSYEKDGRK